jgi:hypothetical protein
VLDLSSLNILNSRCDQWRLSFGRFCACTITFTREPITFSYLLHPRSSANIICVYLISGESRVYVKQIVGVQHLIYKLRIITWDLKVEIQDATKADQTAGVYSIQLLPCECIYVHMRVCIHLPTALVLLLSLQWPSLNCMLQGHEKTSTPFPRCPKAPAQRCWLCYAANSKLSSLNRCPVFVLQSCTLLPWNRSI